jgi:uncharacterized FlaG/YvyC family protein
MVGKQEDKQSKEQEGDKSSNRTAPEHTDKLKRRKSNRRLSEFVEPVELAVNPSQHQLTFQTSWRSDRLITRAEKERR